MNTPPTVLDLAAATRAGSASAPETCAATLAAIQGADPRLNAFREVHADAAITTARNVDRDVVAGTASGPLAGVPIALKDNIVTRVGTTSAGSRMLAGYRSPYDATAATRLAEAGAILVGKTNCDEFAMGSSTENCAFGPTRNPWDLERVPGGSSGGAAVAVAARLVPASLGSDTGGSIRQPASFCGVVGLKPTYGRVSRYGLIAFGSSLDQIGPITTTVADAAAVLQVIAGHDPADATCVREPVPDFSAAVAEAAGEDHARGLRIGVPAEYFAEGLDPEVEAAVRSALALYAEHGAELVPVTLPHVDKAVAAYYVIATAECSSNLARFDGVRFGHRSEQGGSIEQLVSRSRAEGFGDEVKRRIMLGTFVLSSGYYEAFYDKALRVRRLIQQGFNAALERVDVLACPTAPTTAFRLGEKAADPLQMYLADICTLAVNLAGLPAISIPCGFDSGGLPIGLQLIAPLFDEVGLLRAAQRYEGWTDWHARCPDARRG